MDWRPDIYVVGLRSRAGGTRYYYVIHEYSAQSALKQARRCAMAAKRGVDSWSEVVVQTPFGFCPVNPAFQ